MTDQLDDEGVEDRAKIAGSSEETLARVIKLFAGVAVIAIVGAVGVIALAIRLGIASLSR